MLSSGIAQPVQDGVRKYCNGMIVQFSTSGRGRDPASRGNALELRPDMGSLSTGSVNFPSIVYENSPAPVTDLAARMKTYGVRPEIELFDLSHIHGARRLIEAGLMDERSHVQVVMGVKNALPAEEPLLDVMLGEICRVLPRATWTAAGIGAAQARVIDWVLARGGDGIRTGLEDNIRLDRTRLAGSNAALASLACESLTRHGCRPATPAETREGPGLEMVA
jgi:3-keto-5-aminohexanoate cleavage enzyme